MRHVRTRRMSKEKNQRYHSKVRALQHFGQQLTNLDLEKMAEIYRHSPDTRILRKQTCRLVKAVVTYNNTVYPIIYDKKRHQLVTILKPDYLNEEERRVYDICCAKMHQSNRANKNYSHKPMQTIDVPNFVTEAKPEEPVETTKDVIDQQHQNVILPTKEEQIEIMNELMERINF